LDPGALVPAVSVDQVATEPYVIPGGSTYNLNVECRVKDPNAIEDKLPVDFSFRILKDGQPVFASGATPCRVGNGEPATLTKTGLPSTTTKGAYEVEASVVYRDHRAWRTAQFVIE
jgi:hypothetical protein